ncbi:MAG: NUDIX hydrolase, partial [Angustibacter sp.]
MNAKTAVHAAGAVLWRGSEGSLEVALVHRPKYLDWSWPKGKLDPGESFPAAAVREVREETGAEITLGLPLAEAKYPISTPTGV